MWIAIRKHKKKININKEDGSKIDINIDKNGVKGKVAKKDK